MRILTIALACLTLGSAALAQDSDPIGDLYAQERYEEAFALAQTRANAGSAVADNWLGLMYEAGNGTKADIQAAEQHYRAAARSGENHARWRLGVLMDEGQIAGSAEEAVGFFELCAREDYTDCIVSLAVMQATGRGTLEDDEAAFENYLRAAQIGDPGGMRGVGIMIMFGEGVPQDTSEAGAWILLSASLGNEQSQANLASLADTFEEADFRAIALRAKAIAETLNVPSDRIVIVEE